LAARLGPFRALALLHDGLAAASAYAGAARTAVLILGTSIGVGYAPVSAGSLRMVHGLHGLRRIFADKKY
jgi:hypothetical protein